MVKNRGFSRVVLVAFLVVCLAISAVSVAFAALQGAIYTTDGTCSGVNVNIFYSKGDVYLDGGPAGGGSGLPEGDYYVKVTEPNGTILGMSVGATAHVNANGKFATCYQLETIVKTASSAYASAGYDTTSNNGGEYKVWVSPTSDFAEKKTDNFKVRLEDNPPQPANLIVNKFYDANANGVNDNEQLITGWQVRIQDGIDFIRYTPVFIVLDPDKYTVTESSPVETNWIATTTNPVVVTINSSETKTVEFGNLCLGAGGGLTLGFWSNKNGAKLFEADDLALMVGLNLRNANGSAFDPASYAAFRTWLLGATATNMANMLSAQLAAMELNVLNGKVAGGSLIYAPGTNSANALGFASVSSVMAEANAELGVNGLTPAGHLSRAYQEKLKNALDAANNNLNFVQSTPCVFRFAESTFAISSTSRMVAFSNPVYLPFTNR